jgi:diguanylate cyclase (GGDEF)-like protein
LPPTTTLTLLARGRVPFFPSQRIRLSGLPLIRTCVTLQSQNVGGQNPSWLKRASQLVDGLMMGTGIGSAPEHHVSGLYVTMLMENLAAELSSEEVRGVLSRAGETRSLEEFGASSSWLSYDEFRCLLKEAKRTLDSIPRLDTKRPTAKVRLESELAGTIQAFGSPASVLAANTGTNPLVPIRRYETTEIGPNEWTIREWFDEGFAPFPEFCEFVAQQYAMVPAFFGLPEGEVTEEECQCRGDRTCLFRLRWAEMDKVMARAEYFEARARQLESRLDQLQDMITDLASNERYEDVLQGIVASTMATVVAGGAILALEPRAGHARRIYSIGIDDSEAMEIADDLLEGGRRRKQVASADVASARRHYGVLAIGEEGSLFTSQLQGTLETHARLAAAALDAADALEEARHQAMSAQALLQLSTSLAGIMSTEEMASKVVRAVPDVIDCDRVTLLLDDGGLRDSTDQKFRVMSSFGYSDEVAASLAGRVFTARDVGMNSEYGLVERTHSSPDHVATVSAPIAIDGVTSGFIVVSVASDPTRLSITPRLAERLNGMAAQAAIAINNSRLVDRIRYQAVHDPLTGLPNRALITDRIDRMLARARRDDVEAAVLFVDLDGFKEVNDTFGHETGDRLLKAVAERLSAVMRKSDGIGRLGGDEFIVLVDGGPTSEGPEVVAYRLLEALRLPFELGEASGGEVTLTASIGIAAGDRSSAAELLRDADRALYAAKASGKNCYVVFQ